MNLRRDQLCASIRADERRGASGVDFSKSVQASQEPDRAAAAPAFGHNACSGAASFSLTLDRGVQLTLLMGAKAAGVTPGEFIARAIVAYAIEAVGVPSLCDELRSVPEFARRGGGR
jgi:hypothetical protein